MREQKHMQGRRSYNKPRMRRELSSAYRTVENKAQALVAGPIHYYTKDGPLNTLVLYAAIKIIFLLSAIMVSLRYQPSGLF
jgi:hypothetical protein